MILTMLKSKLHRATVTACDLDYEGSAAIDTALLEAAGILPGEQIDVLSLASGVRITTYAIAAPSGSGAIILNGPAARMAQPGDLVIVMAYAQMDEREAATHKPKVLLLDARNRIRQ
jgi:aspartate 1-decarboxylase